MTKPSHWEMTSGHSEMTIYKKSDADDSKSVTTDFGQTRMTIFKKSFATDRHFSLCSVVSSASPGYAIPVVCVAHLSRS